MTEEAGRGEQSAGKRIAYIDFLKAFAIATVLLGHSVEQLSGDAFWDHPIWAFLYSFHMPLFMFVSGLFFKSALRKDFRKVLGEKLVQLGIPSVSAFLVGLAIMKIVGVTSIADLCEASFAGFMNSVWFLKCLFFCIVIMWLAVKILRHDVLAAVVVSAAVLLVPGGEIVNLNFMLPCFCLGFLCGSCKEFLERHRRVLGILAVVVFLALLPFWGARLTVYMVPTQVLSFSPVSFDLSNLGLSVYRLAIGFAGSLAFYLAAPAVHRLIAGGRFDAFCGTVGGATLGIYVIQTFLLEILVHSLSICLPVWQSCLVAPVLATVELFACLSVVYLFRRFKLTRLLFLGERIQGRT